MVQVSGLGWGGSGFGVESLRSRAPLYLQKHPVVTAHKKETYLGESTQGGFGTKALRLAAALFSQTLKWG